MKNNSISRLAITEALKNYSEEENTILQDVYSNFRAANTLLLFLRHYVAVDTKLKMEIWKDVKSLEVKNTL